MKIYEFISYKSFLRNQIKAMPAGGRGEMTKIAHALGVHTTMVTHVLKGKLNFTLEQTLKLASHWALNDLETDYLVALVYLERAGDNQAKTYCRKRVDELRSRALNLSIRLEAKNELSDSDRAQYYSSWIYSFLRLLTAIDGYSSEQALARATGLPLHSVRSAIDFLVSRKLCVEENGRLRFGPVRTYLESSSPLVAAHHLNWRRKTSERFEKVRPDDLIFTYPVAMSETDFARVREKLIQFIEDFKGIVSPSPSESLYCLNLDWLKMLD